MHFRLSVSAKQLTLHHFCHPFRRCDYVIERMIKRHCKGHIAVSPTRYRCFEWNRYALVLIVLRISQFFFVVIQERHSFAAFLYTMRRGIERLISFRKARYPIFFEIRDVGERNAIIRAVLHPHAVPEGAAHILHEVWPEHMVECACDGIRQLAHGRAVVEYLADLVHIMQEPLRVIRRIAKDLCELVFSTALLCTRHCRQRQQQTDRRNAGSFFCTVLQKCGREVEGKVEIGVHINSPKGRITQ